MKTLKLDPKSAREAIVFVAGVIANRTTLPILSHIRVTANGETHITGTDLDVWLSARLPVTGEMDLCLSKSALLPAAKGCKSAFEIEVNDTIKGCRLSTDGRASTLPTLPAIEFPPAPAERGEVKRVRVKTQEFIHALSQVEMAQSTNHTRYIMNGVCLEVDTEVMRLVATDGRRLHQTEIPCQSTTKRADKARIAKAVKDATAAYEALNKAVADFPDVKTPPSPFAQVQPQVVEARKAYNDATAYVTELKHGYHVNLPSGAVAQILRLPNKKVPGEILIETWTIPSSDKTNVGKGNSYARLTCGDYVIQTKQIDGVFPNWRQVVPADFKEEFVVRADELAAAVKHADTATSDKSNSVYLKLTKHAMTVTGKSVEKGEAKSDVAINYAGAEMSIAFNPYYLADVCVAFKGCDLTVKLIDELSPGTFVHGLTQIVVMPMRLS